MANLINLERVSKSYGVRPLLDDESGDASAVTRDYVLELDARGAPLLSVERVSFSFGNKPVEWRRGLYSTAEHYYLNELN